VAWRMCNDYEPSSKNIDAAAAAAVMDSHKRERDNKDRKEDGTTKCFVTDYNMDCFMEAEIQCIEMCRCRCEMSVGLREDDLTSPQVILGFYLGMLVPPGAHWVVGCLHHTYIAKNGMRPLG
jgi:hypothetical protein